MVQHQTPNHDEADYTLDHLGRHRTYDRRRLGRRARCHQRRAPGVSASGLRRRVIQADALAWLDANPAEPGTSVFTSLPDLSELR